MFKRLINLIGNCVFCSVEGGHKLNIIRKMYLICEIAMETKKYNNLTLSMIIESVSHLNIGDKRK